MSLSLFNRETIEPNIFFFENVLGDNACFYRAISNNIRYNYLNLKKGKVDLTLVEQTKFSRDIQYTCYKWVEKNQKKKIKLGVDNDLEISVEDLVEITHNINLENYLENYKNFSGSLVFTDNFNILSNRWGGYIEQVAISQSLQQPIIILSLQKFNEKTGKIICGRFINNKPYKNTRLRIIQIIGKEFLDINNSLITLLWRKNSQGDHYISVYPKNNKIFKDYLLENF